MSFFLNNHLKPLCFLRDSFGEWRNLIIFAVSSGRSGLSAMPIREIRKAFFCFHPRNSKSPNFYTTWWMKLTRRSCVGIYLWHAPTLLFYMLNSVGLLLLIHIMYGVWRYQNYGWIKNKAHAFSVHPRFMLFRSLK